MDSEPVISRPTSGSSGRSARHCSRISSDSVGFPARASALPSRRSRRQQVTGVTRSLRQPHRLARRRDETRDVSAGEPDVSDVAKLEQASRTGIGNPLGQILPLGKQRLDLVARRPEQPALHRHLSAGHQIEEQRLGRVLQLPRAGDGPGASASGPPPGRCAPPSPPHGRASAPPPDPRPLPRGDARAAPPASRATRRGASRSPRPQRGGSPHAARRAASRRPPPASADA